MLMRYNTFLAIMVYCVGLRAYGTSKRNVIRIYSQFAISPTRSLLRIIPSYIVSFSVSFCLAVTMPYR